MLVAVFCIVGCATPNNNLTKAQYVEVFDSMFATVANLDAEVQSLRTVVTDSDFVEVSNKAQAKNMLMGNVAMLGFFKNLCNTEDFEPSTNFQECVVYDDVTSSSLQTFNIRLNMSYDAETSTVKTTVYCEDISSVDVYAYLLEFEMIYNFETDNLSGFTVLGCMGKKQSLTKTNVNYFKFYDNTLKMLNTSTTTFDSFANDILQEVATTGATAFGENLTDYSTQYIQGMMDAYNAMS